MSPESKQNKENGEKYEKSQAFAAFELSIFQASSHRGAFAQKYTEMAKKFCLRLPELAASVQDAGSRNLWPTSLAVSVDEKRARKM